VSIGLTVAEKMYYKVKKNSKIAGGLTKINRRRTSGDPDLEATPEQEKDVVQSTKIAKSKKQI